MRKSKVLKALLVFGMSIATATSVVGMTACNGEHEHTYGDWKSDKDGHWKVATCHTDVTTEKETHKDDDKDNKCDVCGYTLATGGEEHKHTYGEWKADGDKGHYKEATCHPGEKTATEQHKDANKDGKCDDCKYEMQTETPDHEPPVVKDDVTINIADLTTLIDGESLGQNTGLTAVGSLTVESNSGKKPYFKGETIENANMRLKLDQTVLDNTDATKVKGIKVHLEANATIVVYAYSGSSNKTDRTLALYDVNKNIIEETKQNVGDGNNNILGSVMFNVEANKDYYIGAPVAGVNIYYIGIIYGELDETREEVPAVPATCETAGNKTYYYTNYGRYFESETATKAIIGSSTIISALSHSWAVDGDITQPTADAPGSATLKCANDATHTVDVALPKLTTEGAYKRTENATENTKYDYVFKTSQGIEIKFTADKVEEVVVEVTNYTCDFTDTEKFAAATIIAEKANTDAEILFKDGNKTGLTALGHTTDNKAVKIGSMTAGDTTTQALVFGGSMSNAKNSVQFTVKNAGTITVKVKYFNGNAGRFIKLLAGSETITTDNAIAGKVETDGGTTTDGVIKEATITLTVAANTNVILGSASSGLYVTYLEVQLPVAEA